MGQLMFFIASFASVWVFAAWLACAFFAGHIAAEKNRCGFCWFCWGVLFGPISLVSSVGLPMREPSEERENANRGIFSSAYQPLPVETLELSKKQ